MLKIEYILVLTKLIYNMFMAYGTNSLTLHLIYEI